MKPPFDAIGFLEGSFIKIDGRNRVFYYHRGEWLSSTKNAQLVRAALKRKSNPFCIAGE